MKKCIKCEIDKSLSEFRATSEEDVYVLNHYTNFQPMWTKDNMRKGNRHE